MSQAWPPLSFEAWRDTHATLRLWLQMVGKIRLAQSPWLNHSWHVSLYVTPRGLSTLSIPHGSAAFQIDFDFITHLIVITHSNGRRAELALRPQPVAAFYRALMSLLDELRVPVAIQKKPNEMPEAVPFDQDERPRAYEADHAQRFWRVLQQCDRVLNVFRARFRGKSSPVHFFWGNTDLALTRFSGGRAPEHPGGRPNLPDRVLKDAYSDECWECGFWPGGEEYPSALFYALAYPEPRGFSAMRVLPTAAHYSKELKEFVLPYDVVRQHEDPDNVVLEFLQGTYEAAAALGAWDRAALDYSSPGYVHCSLSSTSQENPMADDLKETGRQDDQRINVDQDHEVSYWSKELGVSRDELRRAVEQAGPMVRDVRQHLSR